MARHSWWSFLPALVLAVLMGLAGQAKVTSLLTPDVHTELASHAPDWSSVLPFHPPPALLLQAIGWAEVAAAALLLLPWTRRLGALLCFAMMAGAVATHLLLSEPAALPAGLATAAGMVWLLSGKGAAGGKTKRS